MNTLFPLHEEGRFDEPTTDKKLTKRFPKTKYKGLLVIGDPHLEGRVPGFRKDDYPKTIIDKLKWCLQTARNQKLLPVILGDLFHLPRDNPNWLVNELIQVFDQKVYGIYGNHDVHENQLDSNDTLSILESAGCIELLGGSNCFRGMMGGRNVLLGGTSWGQQLPDRSDVDLSGEPVVVWLTHHDLSLPGYDAGKIDLPDNMPFDLIVNGHIHRRLDDHIVGRTTLVTPGNIARRNRADATRLHVPSVLVVEFDEAGWHHRYLEVPHRSFEQVFHAAVELAQLDDQKSGFASGLLELQQRRTETGAGLIEFLDANEAQFDPAVACEIQALAKQVLERN